MKVIRTGRLNDRQAVKLLKSFAAEFGSSSKSSIIIAGLRAALDDPSIEEILNNKKDRGLIDSAVVQSSPPKFALHYRRGIGASGGKIDGNGERTPSPYFDEIGFELLKESNGQILATLAETAEAWSAIQKHLIEPVSPDEASEGAANLLNAQFSQLNSLLSEVTERVHARQIELDTQHQQRMAELQRQQQDEVERLRTEFDERKAEVDVRSSALDQRESALDNRQHMHARRELREKMSADLQSRLARSMVSRQSQTTRFGVLGLILLASVGLGALAFFSLQEFTQMLYLSSLKSYPSEQSEAVATARQMILTGTVWYLLVRGALASFGAIAFLVYGISWLKRIYEQDLEAQREFERYSVDINRASWAIETMMEANQNNQTTIPDSLVAALSHNLFTGVRGQSAHTDANEALAEILRASVGARLGPQGVELDINKKGTNALAKGIAP